MSRSRVPSLVLLAMPPPCPALGAAEDPADRQPSDESGDGRGGDRSLARELRRLRSRLLGARRRLVGPVAGGARSRFRHLRGGGVLLRHGLPLDLLGLRPGLGLRLRGLLLRLLLHVGLVGELGDGVAQLLPRGRDLGLDLLGRLLLVGARRLGLGLLLSHQVRASFALRLTYSTSSLVVSIARSGTGGVPSSTLRFPSRAATPAIAA